MHQHHKKHKKFLPPILTIVVCICMAVWLMYLMVLFKKTMSNNSQIIATNDPSITGVLLNNEPSQNQKLLDLAAHNLTPGCTVLGYIDIPLNPSPEKALYTTNDLQGGMFCKFFVHPVLPPYFLYIIGNSSNQWQKIIIYKGYDLEAQQEFTPAMLHKPLNTFYAGTVRETIKKIDVNYDAYSDLKVFRARDMNSNAIYDFFVYNPQTQLFQYDPTLSAIVNPEFNTQNKTISSYINEGGDYSSQKTYVFKDGTYILQNATSSIFSR